VTLRLSGTRYTLFFGSGVPNDPNAARIVGYGEGINPATFQINDEHGMIEVPSSIGRLNHFTVLVFARNREALGWEAIPVGACGERGVSLSCVCINRPARVNSWLFYSKKWEIVYRFTGLYPRE